MSTRDMIPPYLRVCSDLLGDKSPVRDTFDKLTDEGDARTRDIWPPLEKRARRPEHLYWFVSHVHSLSIGVPAADLHPQGKKQPDLLKASQKVREATATLNEYGLLWPLRFVAPQYFHPDTDGPLSGVCPTDVFLRRLADCLEQEAAKVPMLRHPRRSDAHQKYFFVSLSEFLQQLFGSPLHSVVAAAANIILDNEYSVDDVRNALRSR